MSQVHKWIRQGYIVAAESAPAKGRPNRFSFDDLLRLSLLKLLGEHRMLGPESNRQVAGYLVGGLKHASLIREALTIGPDPNGTAWDTRADGPPKGDERFVISINMGLIRRQIEEKTG